MRALVLVLLLAGCGLRATEPTASPRVDATGMVCADPEKHLVTLQTADGDVLGACVSTP